MNELVQFLDSVKDNPEQIKQVLEFTRASTTNYKELAMALAI
jgi:hypothetical protein